ncbi:hypothetical protein ABTY00_06230 [Streptomyces microflavus]|uniref:hypothetical protein n=1 Tax=Streptomyces microflavus TaxID=1919 RepID=UPI00331C59E7
MEYDRPAAAPAVHATAGALLQKRSHHLAQAGGSSPAKLWLAVPPGALGCGAGTLSLTVISFSTRQRILIPDEPCEPDTALEERGFNDLLSLTSKVSEVLDLLPGLIEDLYVSVLGHTETSWAGTRMGSGSVLTLVSDRRQDFDAAKYPTPSAPSTNSAEPSKRRPSNCWRSTLFPRS